MVPMALALKRIFRKAERIVAAPLLANDIGRMPMMTERGAFGYLIPEVPLIARIEHG